jgi:hypothetical protein
MYIPTRLSCFHLEWGFANRKVNTDFNYWSEVCVFRDEKVG